MSDLDFSVVKKAGIATAHFARLCGISRVSASLYLSNTRATQPRGLYRRVVARVLEQIEAALAAGRLPLGPTRRADKFSLTVRALKK